MKFPRGQHLTQLNFKRTQTVLNSVFFSPRQVTLQRLEKSLSYYLPIAVWRIYKLMHFP